MAGKSPHEVLRWALGAFPPDRIAIACSFGAEDVVIVHMAAQILPGVRVFYLDTDLLFPETYATRDRVAARYPIRLEQVRPALSLEEQARRYGDDLWARDPDLCCSLRKVEPLRGVLAGLWAWITGIRREQSPTRAHAREVEWDKKFGLVKVNPLVRWTWEEVWGYIRGNEIPYNPLHDRNYPSIGCIHCTRPVKPGEHFRAGRWAGFQKTECGLHE
ncbi:MAG: phosphoadenylyl-sulfate reductase [Firmicutes bacterium]|nr:phosphoadenylyl-sulfate reductase [Bacillota bacterium]